MKVAMYYSNNDVRLEDMSVPEIGSGELLIQVEASGLCGTDVMEWYRIHRVPLVLGHEIAGTIVEAGDDVKRYKVGDRVSASHHVPCDKCHYCVSGHQTVCETLRKSNFEPGGFAQYLRLPAINTEYGVYPLNDEVSFEEATFIEPLACVLRGQRFLGEQKGKTVLIIGSGISGVLHVQMSRLNGAKRIFTTDLVSYRLEKAKVLGADETFNARDYSPENLAKNNDGRLADLVILCSGARGALEHALTSLERGGTVLFFAACEKDLMIPYPINDIFWRNEVTFTSSYAATPSEHMEALELIQSRKINVKDMITHRVSLNEAGVGFKTVADAKESLKVIVEPQKF